jgi:hypothetical protein
MFLNIIKEILHNLDNSSLHDRNTQHIIIQNLLMLYKLFNNNFRFVIELNQQPLSYKIIGPLHSVNFKFNILYPIKSTLLDKFKHNQNIINFMYISKKTIKKYKAYHKTQILLCFCKTFDDNIINLIEQMFY